MSADASRLPRLLAVVDAPSNLGLRPPAEGTVPGCYKLAGALRDCGFVKRLAAQDAGCVTPPRYDRGGWKPGRGVFNANAMAAYTRRLADRLGDLFGAGRFPIVLGGDCSILLGAALALNRRGRYGLAFLDGHSDFRHLGNAAHVGAAAGEDLALVTGRGQADLSNIEGRRPYLRDADVAVLGIRDADEALAELGAAAIPTWEVSRLRGDGPAGAAHMALARLEAEELDGFGCTSTLTFWIRASCPRWIAPTPTGSATRSWSSC
jgi:arginase